MPTFKTNYSGSTTGAKTGQLYRFDAGDEFPGPKGEFDHDSGISETKAAENKSAAPTGPPTDENTVDEIKDWLNANKIKYKASAKKDELLSLVK